MAGGPLDRPVLALDVPLVAGLDHGGLYRSALEVGKDRERHRGLRIEAPVAEPLGQ